MSIEDERHKASVAASIEQHQKLKDAIDSAIPNSNYVMVTLGITDTDRVATGLVTRMELREACAVLLATVQALMRHNNIKFEEIYPMVEAFVQGMTEDDAAIVLDEFIRRH